MLRTLLLGGVAYAAAMTHEDDAERARITAEINSDPHSTWRAQPSRRFQGRSFNYTSGLCGVLRDGKGPALGPNPNPPLVAAADVPDAFDAREQWGDSCPSVKEVRDQADCGSCWAFGAVSAGTDRVCIQSNGKTEAHLSAEHLNSCCDNCGMGCNGGYPSAAWNFFTSGIVTGGNYNDFSWCSSYSLKNCDHHLQDDDAGKYGPCPPGISDTPTCPRKCDKQTTYPTSFNDDKKAHMFKSSYSVPSNVLSIQKEIMTNGPIEVAFTVYSDFEQYSSGVYQHRSGSALGGHAVKMLGWGTDGGTPYWIIANSWNEDWGEDGFFRIKRGNDECGIESEGVAGMWDDSHTDDDTDDGAADDGAAADDQADDGATDDSSEDCHYEDPNASGGCRDDETGPIQIQGIDGSICAPQCGFAKPCPTDACGGATAAPQCALQDQSGDKFCALICSPDTKPENLRAGDAQCGGEKASCKPIQGLGICTWDS